LIAFRWIDCKSDDGYTAVQWEAAQVNPARDRRFGNIQVLMMLGIKLRGKKNDGHHRQSHRIELRMSQTCNIAVTIGR
jgi:hypothetical protein